MHWAAYRCLRPQNERHVLGHAKAASHVGTGKVDVCAAAICSAGVGW